MDRLINYPGQIPLETDLLNTNKNVMLALGYLAQDLLGTATLAAGLACSQLGTPSLNVQVGPGRIYQLMNVDGSAYSSIAADTTHQVIKQGILMDAINLATPAPGTAGYSINYLIEATYQDSDTVSVTLPYYNASNPTQAYTGPNNSGASQPTSRKGVIVLQAKAGIAATTGTQTTPAPDSGYVGLWVVTVANGQSSVLNANIAQYPNAPFLVPLAQKFATALMVVGNGPWANPAIGDSQHLLEIVNDNTSYQCMALSAYGASTNGNNLHWNRYFGTLAAPTPVQSAAYFMSMGFRGWDGSGTLSQSMASYQAIATENWSAGSHGIKFHWELAKSGGATSRLPCLEIYAGPTDGAIMNLGDGSSLFSRLINASTTGSTQVHGSNDQFGAQATLYGSAHATYPSQAWYRANLTRFQTVGGADQLVLDASGNLIAGASSATAHTIYKAQTPDAGNPVLFVGYSGNASAFYAVSGSGANVSNAALRLLKDATTLRSLNAGGTINGSGADYAEYMRKAAACGVLAKGDVVGVDADGKLTDKWADAISFLIKSTDPSYVGGDTWGTEAELGIQEPVEPTFTPPTYSGGDRPANISSKPEDYDQVAPAPAKPELAADAAPHEVVAAGALYAFRQGQYQDYLADRSARIAAHDAQQQGFDAALTKYEADIQAYQKVVADARAAFEAGPLTAYEKDLEAFRAAHETARRGVDRMAFAGQVPVNVLGAKPGDYIVPVQAGDGIKGAAVSKPSFEQYQVAVGRVIAIEADSRARVIVKVA